MAHNTSEDNSTFVADALIAAEIDGQYGHGLSRLAAYAAQAASGKIDGQAVPQVIGDKGAVIRIDAGNGFAFPALEQARREVISRISAIGMVATPIVRSHHFGQAGFHVEKLAEQGLIGLLFGNSPQAIAPWGGHVGIFGTNPIAFAAPRRDRPPLVIDLSLSKIARGKVMVAARNNQKIEEGLALDVAGHPTTDAQAALEGTMLPMGDAKGYALVLMVEILAAALTGANFGFEATSFFTPDGDPPGVGQMLIAFDPAVFSGGVFADRLEVLIDAILAQDGTRLPGSRRLERRDHAAREGVIVADSLYDELQTLISS